MIDVVTVFHNEQNYQQHLVLREALDRWERGRVTFTAINNRAENRGFGPACNLGAKEGEGDIIGFINPDAIVDGPFVDKVERVLADPVVAITGCRYGKPQRELDEWKCRDWVCGAAMFVRRAFFESVGGFDEQFVWGFEETDLIRRAQADGYAVRSIPLPIAHASPTIDVPQDIAYKRHWFDEGSRRFYRKWGR